MKSSFKIDFADLTGNGIEPIVEVTLGDKSVEDKLLKTLVQSCEGNLKITYFSGGNSNCSIRFDDNLEMKPACDQESSKISPIKFILSKNDR